jgi:hypothetical protein
MGLSCQHVSPGTETLMKRKLVLTFLGGVLAPVAQIVLSEVRP